MSQWEDSRKKKVMKVRFFPTLSKTGPLTKKDKLVVRMKAKPHSKKSRMHIDKTFAPKKYSADVLRWVRQSVFGEDVG